MSYYRAAFIGCFVFAGHCCFAQNDSAVEREPSTPEVDHEQKKFEEPTTREIGIATRELRIKFKIDRKKRPPMEAAEKLAVRLLKYAETAESPAMRFVALQEAGYFSSKSADCAIAKRVVAQMLGDFSIDRFSLLGDIILATDTVLQSPTERAVWSEWAMQIGDEALSEERIDFAHEFYRAAAIISRTIPDSTTFVAYKTRRDEIKQLRKVYEESVAHLERLEMDPDDPKANYGWGYYLCFVRAKWTEGIPLLAKSNAPELKEVAQMELADSANAQCCQDTANKWLQIGELSEDTGVKNGAIESARYWLAKAVSQSSGPAKLQIEKRLSGLPKTDAESRSE